MGMASLWEKCLEVLKSMLSSQEFGTEYEFLCAQLSIQWLRIRLWQESVSLHVHDMNLSRHSFFVQVDRPNGLDSPIINSTFIRPDIHATVTRAVTFITYILSELDEIRKKYEVKPRLEVDRISSPVTTVGSKTLAVIRPASVLRRRIRDHQKQASFIAITTWTIKDAKKFAEKVAQVKLLIDDLEDIVAASTWDPTLYSASTAQEEHPPRYSDIESIHHQMQQSDVSPINDSSDVTSDTPILLQYQTFETFLASLAAMPDAISPRVREKMSRLSTIQFQELCFDVYDDLLRRQHLSGVESLPANVRFHPKRNQARVQLSSLLDHRFQQMVSDVASELKTRLPGLPVSQTSSRVAHFSQERVADTRQHGVVPELSEFSPSRQQVYQEMPDWPLPWIHGAIVRPRPTSTVLGQVHSPTSSHVGSMVTDNGEGTRLTSFQPRTLDRLNSRHLTLNSTKMSSVSISQESVKRSSSTPSAEIFKSFRVKMDDPCSMVLPAALKKYNINANWEDYSLYLVHGSTERCLGLDEKPLLLFKALDRAGEKPMFMLRKRVGPGADTGFEGEGASSVSPTGLL